MDKRCAWLSGVLFYTMFHRNRQAERGWRPLFQKHRAFDSFRKLEAFYREHQADSEIYDEYGRQYSWEEYFETVYGHSQYQQKPMKWVYDVTPMFPDKKPHLWTVA